MFVYSHFLFYYTVYIESFHVDNSSNNTEPTIIIKSSSRSIQMQCINKNSHEKWVQVNFNE